MDNKTTQTYEKLLLVLEKLNSDSTFVETFSKFKTAKEFYDYCVEIENGYSYEEFVEFFKNLDENEIEAANGGISLNSKKIKALSGFIATSMLFAAASPSSIKASHNKVKGELVQMQKMTPEELIQDIAKEYDFTVDGNSISIKKKGETNSQKILLKANDNAEKLSIDSKNNNNIVPQLQENKKDLAKTELQKNDNNQKLNDGTIQISDEESLKAAVLKSNFKVKLKNNIIIKSVININNFGIIDGNGHTISVVSTGTDDQGKINPHGSKYGVFDVSSKNSSASSVKFKNLNIKGGRKRAINVDSSSYANFENVSISNTYCPNFGGGGIRNKGFITMKNCNISKNTAYYGGGILNTMCAVAVLENCSLIENKTLGFGGGAIENKGNLFLNLCTVSNNQSSEIGGAINNYGGNTYVINSTLTGNVSTLGGAIGQNGGKVVVVNSILTNNYEKHYGEFIPSDIGIYHGENVIMYNSIYDAYLKNNQKFILYGKNNRNNVDGLFASYNQDYNRPVVVNGKVPLSANSVALKGGANIYFDYSSLDNILLFYKDNEKNILKLSGTNEISPKNKVIFSYADMVGACGLATV